MTWRESTIAHCKQSITKLRDRIDRMRAGTFEVRELEHGKWVVINHGFIAQDEKTIANLEEIIARAEDAEIADVDRT